MGRNVDYSTDDGSSSAHITSASHGEIVRKLYPFPHKLHSVFLYEKLAGGVSTYYQVRRKHRNIFLIILEYVPTYLWYIRQIVM